MDVTFWNISNNTPNSDSVADAMNFFMILHSTSTGPFSGFIAVIGVLLLGFGSRGGNTPALLCASGYEQCDVSE